MGMLHLNHELSQCPADWPSAVAEEVDLPATYLTDIEPKIADATAIAKEAYKDSHSYGCQCR